MTEDKRKEKRQSMTKNITFHFESDLFFAKSVDVSGSGMQIETNYPINITIFLEKKDGEIEEYNGQLVWAHARNDGGMSYGLSLDGGDE